MVDHQNGKSPQVPANGIRRMQLKTLLTVALLLSAIALMAVGGLSSGASSEQEREFRQRYADCRAAGHASLYCLESPLDFPSRHTGR